MSTFTHEAKADIASDVAKQLVEQMAPLLEQALLGMVEQIDAHVTEQIRVSTAEVVRQQREGILAELRRARDSTPGGEARRVLGNLVRRMEAS
jgi:hypothetical protein